MQAEVPHISRVDVKCMSNAAETVRVYSQCHWDVLSNLPDTDSDEKQRSMLIVTITCQKKQKLVIKALNFHDIQQEQIAPTMYMYTNIALCNDCKSCLECGNHDPW